MKKFLMSFLVLSIWAGSCFSQVSLCGCVRDENGKALTNTIVRLGQTTYDNGFGQNPYITKTDNAGYYNLGMLCLGSGICGTPVFKGAKGGRANDFLQPCYIGGQVLFSIPQDNLQVKMGLYDLKGRFVKELMNIRLSKGNYVVWIDTRAVSSQFYALRVTVNGASSVFKLQPLSRVWGASVARNAPPFQTKLEKLAAIVDTLHATEPGYSIGVTPIDVLEGRFNFTLTRVSTFNGDTAAFWGNTGTFPTNTSYVILNRTNGAFPDSKIYWSFGMGGAKTPISQQASVPITGMGRFYIWVAPTDSNNRYFDFVEYNGSTSWLGNTTRVDGWRLPITYWAHSSTGHDNILGDAYDIFYESRQQKFDEYKNEVPKEFTGLATHDFANIWAPHTSPVNYFGTNGPYVNYYTRYEDSVAVYNPGPAPTTAIGIFECGNGGMGSSPDYCACINRHVGTLPKGANNSNWYNDTNYYKGPPCNYFSRWCHRRSLYNRCYGFPYDDVGSHSSFSATSNVQWVALAIGW